MGYMGDLTMYTWPYFSIKDTFTGERSNIWTDFGMEKNIYILL